MSVRMVTWTGTGASKAVDAFLRRRPFDPDAEKAAAGVLEEVRRRGNRAVAQYARRFDGVSLRVAEFRVSRRERNDARKKAPADFRTAVRAVLERIAAFARAGMRPDWRISGPRGGTLGEQFVPLDRVGVYVPGGAAPLVSTALMTAGLAHVAGVPEIVACTPCGPDRRVKPELLYALEAAGATEIYRVGGIQAVGMMAYGTRTVRKVQKIVGPGGPFVTAAKRQVYGHVALDLVAGPSEIAVLADETADPAFVAADMLSQAEHGTGHEKALLATTSAPLAKAVAAEIDAQARTLGRQEAVLRVLRRGMLLVVVGTLDRAMDLCNRFAPEHLEIMVREPKEWLRKVRRAGAVFVGKWTPEVVGDFAAGPSHVLPTGGSAAWFSGLTVDDFRRRSSFISFTRADLLDVMPWVESLSRVEGMDGHARAARIRFEKT